jgi:hypothetical protein
MPLTSRTVSARRARRALPLLAVGGLVAACVFSAAALAGSSYSVHVKVPSSVTKSHKFTVKASGSAKRQSELYVYLDRKKCLAHADKEAARDAQYKHGHSYFELQGEGGTFKSAYYFAFVNGSFKETPTAHAGSKTGDEHACAYVVSKDKFGNYSTTAASAHARYAVKKT